MTSLAKPRVRYRPGVGFFRVWHVNYGVWSRGSSVDDWREFLIGPYLTLTEAAGV